MISFESTDISIPIRLIKEYIFCPRIPWILQNVDIKFSFPEWVEQGKKYQEYREKLLMKRSLFRNPKNLPYKQRFDVEVKHEDLKIHGKIDVLIETEEEAIPVEIKLTAIRPAKGHIFQLVGYALCIEKEGKNVKRLIVVTGRRQKRHEILFTEELRNEFLKILDNLKESLQNPFMPYSSATIQKCAQCNFINFCLDRDL